jgi:hypothetical protein
MTAFTSTIQKMYVAFFNRPADYNGLANWEAFAVGKTVAQLTTAISVEFAKSAEYTIVFAGMSHSQIVTRVYQNLLNREPDTAGLKTWVDHLVAGRSTVSSLVTDILRDAGPGDVDTIANKVAASQKFTDALDTVAKINAYSGAAANQIATAWLSQVGETAASLTAATSAAALLEVTTNLVSNAGGTYVLTNGSDTATANKFTSGLVYNPAGTDRINALQDEDTLTGVGTNPTLNLSLGRVNDNGNKIITPKLINIETINAEFSGDANTVDLRNADDIKVLAVTRITADASDAIKFQNISQEAADLTVRNTSSVNQTVTFEYVDGILDGTRAAGTKESGKVSLSNTNLKALNIGNAGTGTEGFEAVELNSSNNVNVKTFKAVDLEDLTIKGSGNLSIVNTTAQDEKTEFDAKDSGLGIGDGIGIRTIDASAFTGTLNLDITNAVGKHNDPANSGAPFYATIKGGTGNDTFWAGKNIVAESATLLDTIDGGAGNNTLRTYANITPGGAAKQFNAKITNIQTLEMRNGGQSADLDAFDAALSKVILREENADGKFQLDSVGATLATSGNIILQHATTKWNGNTNEVVINLKDASGTADNVIVKVENERNTETTFNYTLNIDGDTATQKVESVKVVDADTESNTLTLTNAAEHTTAVVLEGGVAGQKYVVASTLVAKTVDAEHQLSDLTIKVGPDADGKNVDQTIKLGSGADMLTFDGVDNFTGADKITDKAGIDTMRAAFSKDVAGTPEIAGIEKLHIVATANTAIDLAKVTGMTELALLSDKAVDAANEVFTTGLTGVEITDVVTLKNTTLNTINFFGDADGKDPVTGDGGDTNKISDSSSYTQTFNGLTLENNTGDKVEVKIAAPLVQGTDSLSAGDGIKAYNLGQLTTHGVKTLEISVANEYSEDGKTVKAGDAVTTIANIWDRDLVDLKLTAQGSVNVGTVTGNTVNSNMKTFNAAGVLGNVTAVVKALGDNAVVTLSTLGDDKFDALGSAGNNVTIQGGDGKNNITGTAQSDYIYTGTGNDTIDANRGNNTVKSGAGNDTVKALNGSNTVDLGSGFADSATFSYDTVAQQNLATNVVAGSGTIAKIGFDANNDGDLLDVGDATFGFAVGAGAELSIKFTGTTFDAAASTLNGRSAISGVDTQAGITGHANYNASQSNLVVFTANPVLNESFAGGSAADVFLDLSTGVGNAYSVSAGAGNDSIVISQSSTAAHTITGGTGADRIMLSAAAGVDTLVVAEGDSTAAAWDVISGFNATAADRIDVSTVGQVGTDAKLSSLDFNGDGTTATDLVAVSADGYVTVGTHVIGSSAAGAPSLAAVLSFLAARATTTNDVFFVQYDSNGNGTIDDGVDNTVVFQNLGTDIVVEIVGNATTTAAGLTIADLT